MKKITLLTMITALLFVACNEKTSNSFNSGTWKGELAVQDKWAPFLFEVKTITADSAVVTLINGSEKVELSGVHILNDSVTIPIVAYDAYIKAELKNGKLNGKFIKNYIENDLGVDFRATYNQTDRFPKSPNASDIKIDGKWDVSFINVKNDTTANVGVFKTDGNIVTGSVLTNYGDLRFLEGKYSEDGVALSAFGGLSPYLLELSFSDSDHFTGSFFTTQGITRLEGTRNDKADLADPYSLTSLKDGYETLSFSLPNLEGEQVSINDEKYKNKVVIISILGSWCPNCLDEMEYLSPWYDENKNRGIEIVGLAFERKDDFEYAQGTLSRLIDRYSVNYEILFAGQIGGKSVEKALPELEKVSSYPTTIFIDKKGKVRKIHTGFNGPATGLFYEEFKRDFNALIDELVNE